MVKLEKLIPLEKAPIIDISQCNIIENWYDNEKGLRTRILQKDDRYFLHYEKANGETFCVEVAVEWRVRADKIYFGWTPDDKHIFRVLSGGDHPSYDVLSLKLEQIQPGDTCSYKGMEISYVDNAHIRLNSVTVTVVKDHEFIYSLRKKWIRAIDGAAGFFRFMENMSAEYNAFGILPVYCGLWENIFAFYKADRKDGAAA